MAAEENAVRAEGDQYIPPPKAAILDALIEHGALDERQRVQFRQLGRELAAIYHYNYFDQLERLRADYFYFNPEREPHARFDGAARERAYADLVEAFDSVLVGANFAAIP